MYIHVIRKAQVSPSTKLNLNANVNPLIKMHVNSFPKDILIIIQGEESTKQFE